MAERKGQKKPIEQSDHDVIEFVDFSQYEFTPSAESVLRAALGLMQKGVLDADWVLRAVVGIAIQESGTATLHRFRTLLADDPHVREIKEPLRRLQRVPVARDFQASIAVAQRLLDLRAGPVSTRDLITIALLSSTTSLGEFVAEADVALTDLRLNWLEYLTSTDSSRPADDWVRWYREVGAPTGWGDAPRRSLLVPWEQLGDDASLETISNHLQGGLHVETHWSPQGSMEPGARIYPIRRGEGGGLLGVGVVDGIERVEGQRRQAVIRWLALSEHVFLPEAAYEGLGLGPKVYSVNRQLTLSTREAAALERAWPDAWERAGHAPAETPPESPLPPTHHIALLDADTGHAEDALGVDVHAHAFAHVMASRKLRPPLSIGLFGDWGSGKTFFMERIFSKVKELKDDAEPDDKLFHANICQIRFNAWHYAETNLWASLVSTIFQELRSHLDGDQEEGDEFNRLLKELEISGALREEAQARLREAKDRLTQARTLLEEERQKLLDAGPPPQPSDAALRKILSKSLTQELENAEDVAQLLNRAGEWCDRPDLKEAAEAVRYGRTQVNEGRELLADVQALASRSSFWWRTLSAARLHHSLGFWVLVAALAAIPIVAWKSDVDGWVHLWGATIEILAVLGAGLAWLRARVSKAHGLFDRLDRVRTRVEDRIDAAREEDRQAHEGELARYEAQITDLEAELAQRQAAHEEALAAERAARQELQESTSQARLHRFIRERAASADYEKHLGLIAMIHRDFERMSELMSASDGAPRSNEFRGVDRIILYIDDLDRCHPPERVVRVLEAVHLLLFFPLFVVVVGVDSRWISRALYKHYDGMLGDEGLQAEGKNAATSERAPANSQDFLEKIFQVPFWLRRMEPSAVQQLVKNLVSTDEVESTAEDGGSQRGHVPPTDLGGRAEVSANGEALEDLDDPDDPDDLEDPDDPDDPDPAWVEDFSIDVAEASGEAAEAELVSGPPAATVQSLRITDHELAFMQTVAPLMPRSPRSVKRFVNVYRIYKASLSASALARFLGTKATPGNYRAVQVLLALVTGTPGFAQDVLEKLHDREANLERLSDMVAALASEGDPQSSTRLALERFATGENDLDLATLRYVSPLVGRYSVHHMLSREPVESIPD